MTRGIDRVTLGAIIAAMLLVSCGASHRLGDERIEQDVRFGYDKLRGSSLLVAGVASGTVGFSPAERVRTGGAVSNMLIDKMGGAHDIRVIGVGSLASRLGLDTYDALMQHVDMEDGLSREDLPVFDQAFDDIGYILLAFILNENVVDFEDEHHDSSREGEQRVPDYEKRYYLTIDFQLYDARNEKMVWSNVIYNEVKDTERRTTPSGFLSSLMSNIFQRLLFGMPADISREEVLDSMVGRFVENLRKARPQ
jgi:hypothetical protein